LISAKAVPRKNPGLAGGQVGGTAFAHSLKK
jgi:hypothetical protein